MCLSLFVICHMNEKKNLLNLLFSEVSQILTVVSRALFLEGSVKKKKSFFLSYSKVSSWAAVTWQPTTSWVQALLCLQEKIITYG